MSIRESGTRRQRVQVTVPVQVLEARERVSALGLNLSAHIGFVLARALHSGGRSRMEAVPQRQAVSRPEVPSPQPSPPRSTRPASSKLVASTQDDHHRLWIQQNCVTDASIRIESFKIEVSVNDLFLALTPADVQAALACRLRDARKAKGWTQAELATRSGLSVATVARLEQSGQGQLSSVLHLCAALGRLDDFDAVLTSTAPSSLDELRRRYGRGRAP